MLLLINGGPVVWLLLSMSLLCLTIALAKFWQLHSIRPRPAASLSQALTHLEQGRSAQAMLLLNGQHAPRARLLKATLRLIENRMLDAQQIKEESWRLAKLEVNKLTAHLRTLEVVATLAPLLGLFGTVLGMIEAFQAMEAAGSKVDPAVLSGGIWQALLTTAAGLAVAIPVSMLHSYLERRTEREAAGIEDDLQRLFTWQAAGASGQENGAKAQACVQS